MAKARCTGWLILADISGYTRFLTGSELEHADAILEDLVKGLLASVQRPLRLVKLEGDAVFAYALASDVPDGRTIVDRLEDAYHDFRMQLFNIARSSTCTCAACKNAPSLDLKFMLHFGEFLVHDLAGHDDLSGPDVILVHRLLKNEVAEKTGKHAYLLASEAARGRIDALEWSEHTETYEHIGDVRCGMRDMHAVFDELSASGSADVKDEDADVLGSFEVPVPPAVAWEWHMDGEKAVRWQDGLDGWSLQPNSDGRVRAGATVHCAHGEKSKVMRILGWRPYRSATFDSPALGIMPPSHVTMDFVPLEDGGTKVVWKLLLTRRTLFYRFIAWLLGKLFPKALAKMSAKLRTLLAAEAAPESVPRLPAADAAPTAIAS